MVRDSVEENSYIHVTNVNTYSVRQLYDIRYKGKIIFRVNVPFVQWIPSCRLSSLVSQAVRQTVKLGYYLSYPPLVSQLDSIIKSSQPSNRSFDQLSCKSVSQSSQPVIQWEIYSLIHRFSYVQSIVNTFFRSFFLSTFQLPCKSGNHWDSLCSVYLRINWQVEQLLLQSNSYWVI